MAGDAGEPPIATVVAHLRHCAETGTEMHPDVYRVCSNSADRGLCGNFGTLLASRSADGRFVWPATVFWQQTPFGQWGTTLPESWLLYKPSSTQSV